jgi:predicted AAA+ superfamily ATPase
MIRDILLIQKRELEKKIIAGYVERDIELKGKGTDLIKVIIGPRRAGKSFFAMHKLSKLGSFGYANFDDEKILEIKDYDEIINTLNSLYNKPPHLLLDEIQNLDRWELFVNRLQRQGYNLIITGSNSKLLSRELATHLTGRHLLTNVFPFSFKEFLKLEKKELTSSEIKAKLLDYLNQGGYPEPLTKNLDHKDYLSTLFNSIIYSDIVKRFRIRSVQAIEDLAIHLISNTAREFSYNSLSKVTKCKSVHTAEKYLGYLEEAFLFFKLSRFSFKTREQIASNKKIYCIDTGFIHAKAFRFSQELGRLYENLVAIQLKKEEMNKRTELYYWKNQGQEEVDFVVKKGLKIKQLIQVCYELDDPKAKERELRAIIKASKELKCNNLLIITEDKEGAATYKGKRIAYVPLWKWLLE